MSPRAFTMTVMTLLTFLTLLTAGNARFCERDQRPTIAYNSAKKITVRTDHEGVEDFESFYGNNATILCSSKNASNLTIQENEHELEADRFNSTTIQVSLQKPEVGWYKYDCTDSINHCTTTLIVYVVPSMSVRSPGVFHASDKHGESEYLVPPGEEINIFCTANSADLSIEVNENGWRKLQTTTLNDTTVMSTVNDSKGGTYICHSNSGGTTAELLITVDSSKAEDIRCVLNQRNKIDCTWKSSSVKNIFNLSVLHDQTKTLFCIDRSGNLTAGCGGILNGDLEDLLNYNKLSLELQTCYVSRSVFCSTQTFDVNPMSILKLDPIYDLKAVNTSSRNAVVTWRQSFDDLFHYYTYKVEYKLLWTDWRAVDSSAVQCLIYDDLDTCELEVSLPCPDSLYEVRVSARHKNATEDLYWSEPATLFFITAPSTGDAHPACDDASEKPSSATVALYEV